MPAATMSPSLSETMHGMLRRGMIVAGFNCLIAVSLVTTGWDNWDTQLVYSQAIGLSIWLAIDIGRFVLPRDPDTQWPLGWNLVALQVSGIVGGYLVGTGLGDLYSGRSMLMMQASPRILLSCLFLSAFAGMGISYFFSTRRRAQRMDRLVAAARRDAAEIQLKLLQSQLEPHMLFNTLANLRVLIGMDPPRAQLMLDHLIGFLRSTLTASRNVLHPLSAEFARLDDYLALMKVRMGERLQATLDLPADMGELAVPTLLLQPLVENALSHGLEPKIDGGQLHISARREGIHLSLEVHDTGMGIGMSTPKTGGTRFGLEQVRQRLAGLYGPEATLSLEDRPDGTGTVATVRIPLDRTA